MKKLFTVAGTLILTAAFAVTAYAATPEVAADAPTLHERVRSERASMWEGRDSIDLEVILGTVRDRADGLDRENMRSGRFEFSREAIPEDVLAQIFQGRGGRGGVVEINRDELAARFEQFRQAPEARGEGRAFRFERHDINREDIAASIEQFKQNPELAIGEIFAYAEARIGTEIDRDELVTRFELFRQNLESRGEGRTSRFEGFEGFSEGRIRTEINRDDLTALLEQLRQDPQSVLENVRARFSELEFDLENISGRRFGRRQTADN